MSRRVKGGLVVIERESLEVHVGNRIIDTKPSLRRLSMPLKRSDCWPV